MIRYILYQIKNAKSPVVGRWFAKPVITDTVDLSGLAKHMASHNSPYSSGVIKGLLTDMVNCIKELMLEGKNVKLDDLGIFSLGIKNRKGGAESEDDFTVAENITGVKYRARSTGELMPKNLNLVARMKKATVVDYKKPADDGSDDGE
jgi:predicted histone-like DNA-binding protein